MEVLEHQILNFISSPKKSCWFRADGVILYLRKSKRLLIGQLVDALDIASIEVLEPGKGQGSRLIEWIHSHNPYQLTLIESILTDRFYQSLQGRGWTGYGSVLLDLGRTEHLCKKK